MRLISNRVESKPPPGAGRGIKTHKGHANGPDLARRRPRDASAGSVDRTDVKDIRQKRDGMGQHFLVSADVAGRIVSAAKIGDGESVFE